MGEFTPGPSGTGAQARGRQAGYGVGNIAFLNKAEQRVKFYWRAIEEGSDASVGKSIGGAWGGPSERGARHGGELTPFGGGEGQQFIPFFRTMEGDGAEISARVARNLMRGQGQRDPASFGVIKKPIEPHEAYKRAVVAFNPIAREKAAIAAVFGSIARQPNRGQAARPNPSALAGSFISVNVVSQPNVQQIYNDLTSDAAGGFSARLNELHRELAYRLQRAVADELDLVRPDVSTGALKEAILDQRNRFPQ